MAATTEYQANLLGDVTAITEVWLVWWQRLEESGYRPRQEMKHASKLMKQALTNYQRDLFNTLATKVTPEEAKLAEDQYNKSVSMLETLILEFHEGKVTVTED